MDEGVYIKLHANEGFSIQCYINGETILPHPSGRLYIVLGEARIEVGKIDRGWGQFDPIRTAKLGSNEYTCPDSFFFSMVRTTRGEYSMQIDNGPIWRYQSDSESEYDVRFGFKHDSHNCHHITSAHVEGIQMTIMREKS